MGKVHLSLIYKLRFKKSNSKLIHYNVKETVLRFASFEPDTEAVTRFSGERSFGRHRSHAFGKMNQAPIQCFNVKCIVVFLYKLRSFRVERNITTIFSLLFLSSHLFSQLIKKLFFICRWGTFVEGGPHCVNMTSVTALGPNFSYIRQR